MGKVSHGAIVAIALLVAVRAQAQAPASGGTVVRLDSGDLFIDVGDTRVRAGDVLPIYRPMEVRHPVTGRMLRDRFLIGHVRVVQAGTQLSLARPEGPTARDVSVGDVVDTEPPPAPAPAPTPTPRVRASNPTPNPYADGGATAPGPAPVAAAPVPQQDPEQVAVLALFRATLGRPPEERVVLYRAFVQQRPQSPYRDALAADAAMMSSITQLTQVREAAPSAYQVEAASRAELHDTSHVEPVTRWHEGQTPEIAVSARPDLARSVVLHARPVGSGAFSTVRVPLAANGAARILLPIALDRGDGLEYFVEIVGKNGLTEIIGGAGGSYVAQKLPIDWPGSVGRSRARFSTEFISFSTRNLHDQILDIQGDFLYRVQLGWFYGIRLGLATLHGQGGQACVVDAIPCSPGAPAPSPDWTTASFSSGFLEFELRPANAFAVIARVGIGLNRSDKIESESALLAPGGQIRLRIGEERGVNLVLGGEFLPQGDRAFVALAWEVLHGFPMAAEVHVTNQPVWTGDLGVRVVYELGWRISPLAQLSLRVSVQGRNIDHIGPGVGFAATFDW